MKGLKSLIFNPKAVYYKLKQLYKLKSQNKNCLSLNYDQIKFSQVPNSYILSFNPELIIPVYNGYNYLLKLVNTLLSHTHIKYKIIIINDCSTDPEVSSYLSKLESSPNLPHEILIITNEENLGFVKSVNKAMLYTTNHFIILNSDVEVPQYFAQKILSPIINNSNIASATPFTNSGSICSFPNFCKDNEIFFNFNLEDLDNTFGRIDASNFDLTMPTGVGFCMGINKKVYDLIGGFDEVTFLRGYGEENDWCLRAIRCGYKNVIATNCYVYHLHGGSFTEGEKSLLIKKNYKLLLKKHPSYLKEVHKYIALDPLKDLRHFLIIFILTSLKNAICIINTIDTGGAKSYLDHKVVELLEQDKVVLLVSCKDILSKVKLEVFYQGKKFSYYIMNIFGLLEKLKIEQVIINHLLFTNLKQVQASLEQLIKNTNARLSFIIHDYFYLCPSLNLLGYNNAYCNLPALSNCNDCYQKFSSSSIAIDYIKIYRSDFSTIDNWRKSHEKLLDLAQEIIVPSIYVEDLFKKVYPSIESKVQLISHNGSYLNKVPYKLDYIPFSKQTFCVATFGNITKHKGAKMMSSLIKLANKEGLPIRWVILGQFEGSKVFLNNTLNIDKYNLDTLPELINKYEIDVFILPSIWPETYCYVLTEMMHFNLPIISFNIGAQGQRVKSLKQGYVVEEISEGALLEQLKYIIKNHKNF